jgi:VanZ family protein
MRAAERFGRILVVVAWMALISYWSSQNNLPIDRPEVASLMRGFQHRFAHLAAFGALGLLGYWAFGGLAGRALLAILLTSVFGALDEFHQSFTPGRRAAIDDWLMDTASAALAIWVWTRLAWPGWARGRLRPAGPLLVSLVFAMGIGLAVVVRPVETRPALRSASVQVAHGAIDLARSTRDAVRELRASVRG